MAGKYVKRVFVEVASRTDETGIVYPTAITLDGRNFPIDSIRSFRPENRKSQRCVHGDCYSVMIKGREAHLYYLRSNPKYDVHPGRWFVLKNG